MGVVLFEFECGCCFKIRETQSSSGISGGEGLELGEREEAFLGLNLSLCERETMLERPQHIHQH